MDGQVHPPPSDQNPTSSEVGHTFPFLASVNTDAARIAWLSARPEYWSPLPGGGGMVHGVACLLFGVGADGADWLAHLARSEWFAGLAPRAEDLAPAVSIPHGNWVMPASDASGDAGNISATIQAFAASAPLPCAWYATVAVPRGAGPAEQSIALGLVGALTERHDPLGRRMTVVVTVEVRPGFVRDGTFVRRLLDRGAFVVRGGVDPGVAGGNHLHHFPLRAVIMPRQGRLICVDLADYLCTWRPGRAADLHVLPSDFDAAGPALRTLLLLRLGSAGARALNLGFHLDPDAPGKLLPEIDRFAAQCCELLLVPDGEAVFTDTERLDGDTGSVDLLVIHATGAGG